MFDIDGTLVNSYKFDEECYIQSARTVLGIEISSNWEEYTFATDVGILNEVIDRYNITGKRELIQQKFRGVFLDLIIEHVTSNPERVNEIKGAGKFLQHLQSLPNIKIAIATGGWKETAMIKLKAAGININGCAFASSSDRHSRTEIMKLAEQRAATSVPFKSKIYFGDALWDKNASESLGYTFILVGNRIKHDLQINDYQDIAGILTKLNL